MNDLLLAIALWLAFNGSLLLFAWLLFRDDEADELSDFADWEAELARAAAMRRHPAGGDR